MGATVIQSGEGEMLGAGAYQLRFLAESPDQPIAITENAVPPHFPGPVLHRHRELTDIFYLLEGTITMHLDGVEHDVGPGGFVLVPPGVVHAFANHTDEPARFLNIYQPAGNEQYQGVGETAGGRHPAHTSADGGGRQPLRFRGGC